MYAILPAFSNNEDLSPANYVLVELTTASIQRLIDMMSHMKSLNETDSPFQGHIDEIRLSETWCWPWFNFIEGLDQELEAALPEGETIESLGYAIVSEDFAIKLQSMESDGEIYGPIVEVDFPQIVVCGEGVSERIYFSCCWRHTNVVIESRALRRETLDMLLKEAS